LLVTESSRYNLTALRDPETIEKRHFDESLAFLEAVERTGAFGSPAIDIGTGAGFPGLPVKIVRPDLESTLLEATRKKAEFLTMAVEALGLEGVSVVNGRAETVAHEAEHRERYALAMARAVAQLRVLVELALPFVRMGGYLAAQKGSGAEREVRESARALEVVGGEVALVERIEAPGAAVAPRLVLVRKVRSTPDEYPRRPGMPSKRPL
jgi:16S rRNA (guanine527-N7)-methyltransferase